jgi:hypothetical protein
MWARKSLDWDDLLIADLPRPLVSSLTTSEASFGRMGEP